VTNNNLLYNLNSILKNYIPDSSIRKSKISSIALQFSRVSLLKYPLSDSHYLILTKDERKVKSLRRYENSPLPLLSNLECFRNTISSWNSDLLEYGIKSRSKLNEPSTGASPSSHIYLVYYKTLNSRGNHYLKTQYKRLSHYRTTLNITSYWQLCWQLLRSSQSFRLACLNSWQPRWYREYNYSELQLIWRTLNQIVNMELITTQIRNVWIESPRSKWRQLGIPPKGWRLYLHILNKFLSYIYSPHLPSPLYEGFLYNRGCKSWWEDLLWGDYLSRFPFIQEVDLSSGFPNLNRPSIQRALECDGLVPSWMITLIMHCLSSPLTPSSHFPTFESYVENKFNQSWRKGSRSVHMGLGISPILFVITLNWALQRSNLTDSHFQHKWYADDGSFYFTLRGLYALLQTSGKNLRWICSQLLRRQNIILNLFNTNRILKEVGINLCPRKSSLVRFYWIWLKPFKSLGLQLSTSDSIIKQMMNHIISLPISLDLSGSTRGRGSNPLKGKSGTQGSRTLLNFGSSTDPLNLLKLLKSYKKYFGLLMSRLYESPSLPKPDSLPSSRKSIIIPILSRRSQRRLKIQGIRIDKYNLGIKMNELFLSINHPNEELHPLLGICGNYERELKYVWKVFSKNPWEQTLPPYTEETQYPLGIDKFYKYEEVKATLTPELLSKSLTEYSKLPSSPNCIPLKPPGR